MVTGRWGGRDLVWLWIDKEIHDCVLRTQEFVILAHVFGVFGMGVGVEIDHSTKSENYFKFGVLVLKIGFKLLISICVNSQDGLDEAMITVEYFF